MLRDLRVLVFPGGTEIGLEIQKSLSECKEVLLFAAGDYASHAPFVFARHFQVSHLRNPKWFEELKAVVEQNKIDLIYPAHDDAQLELVRRQSEISAQIISSPLETCEVCRSKSLTHSLLSGIVNLAAIYKSPEEITKFPAFLKPDRGQGSFGTQLIESIEQARACDRNGKILLEYLPGEEFTIDCFSHREKGLLFCSGRRRIRIRGGISVRTEAVNRPEFRQIAEQICRRLKFHGAWFFQVKENYSGELSLLEAAPRIAGAMSFHRVQGINFALLTIYENKGEPLSIMTIQTQPILDRALINRFSHNLQFDSLYIDLDDTLIVRNQVSLLAIRLIYQCLNKKIPVMLITRHDGDLKATLSKYRLNGLFDEILHLPKGVSKADYIKSKHAILIDDSFAERKDVSERLAIPTFDNSMIELILDERL